MPKQTLCGAAVSDTSPLLFQPLLTQSQQSWDQLPTAFRMLGVSRELRAGGYWPVSTGEECH